jgi:hypothetical protein
MIMKLISRSLKTFFSATTLFSATLYADTIERSNDLGDRDIQAIREWINTKRQVTVREIGGALSLSGEVRAEFQATGETVNGIRQRGQGSATDLNSSAYDVEVNVMLDYRSDRTWAAIKLEFDNNAGINSGSYNRIKLEKAYFGCRMVDADTFTSDIEIGRRKLSNIVDSKIEFCCFFDGIWFKYDHGFEKFGDFYIHAGPFIINERINQYAYLGETGVFDIGGTGFYTKYSLIDWDTKHFHERGEHDRFNFLVSQFILGYKFVPKPFNKAIIIYSAALYNHKAKKLDISDRKRSNFGGYLGFSIGELKKKADWSFDINYQILAAQTVPDFDVCGIGLGNATDSGFYTSDIDGSGGPTTRSSAAGNGNYRGFVATLDYLITNNLTIEQQWQQSITLDTNIGPFRRFKQYEIELIYAF